MRIIFTRKEIVSIAKSTHKTGTLLGALKTKLSTDSMIVASFVKTLNKSNVRDLTVTEGINDIVMDIPSDLLIDISKLGGNLIVSLWETVLTHKSEIETFRAKHYKASRNKDNLHPFDLDVVKKDVLHIYANSTIPNGISDSTYLSIYFRDLISDNSDLSVEFVTSSRDANGVYVIEIMIDANTKYRLGFNVFNDEVIFSEDESQFISYDEFVSLVLDVENI